MGKRKQAGQGLIVRPPEPSPAAVLQVRTWIVEGQQAADIVESIAATFPCEKPDLLLPVALRQLGDEYAKLNADVARGFLLNAYREIYRRAFEINDFSNSLAALRAFERQIGAG
jgi:hypothetical protein